MLDGSENLKENDLQFHCQVVLCPGVNDGDILRRTIEDLASLYPAAQSMAIVPVGLTKHREGLAELKGFDADSARDLIDYVKGFQEKYLQEFGTRFVYPSDEFYCICNEPLPETSAYEDFPQIENGSAAYTSQNEEEATYSHLIKKSDGYTDFNESAVQIERKIRAYADWPSCYTYIDGGLQLKLYKAEAIPGESSTYAPGTVSAVDKHDYTISCQEGSLKVLEQQLQGKKRMGAGDFMRGHKLTPGDRFCAEEDK